MVDMEEKKPISVGFVADLMSTTKIEPAAVHAGFEMVWVETAVSVAEVDPLAPPERPGERLHGREGKLMQKLIDLQPALLLFDLSNQAIPWQQWMAIIKSSPATKRIPIIAFGPHEDVDLMRTAKESGCDQVLARSRFFSDMPQLLRKYAHIPDLDVLVETCAQPLPELAQEGIALFKQGEVYKCHDSLEEAWKDDQTAGRDLYQGILQTGMPRFAAASRSTLSTPIP